MGYVTEILGEPTGYEKITPGDVVTGFTAALITPTTGDNSGKAAKAALITCEDETVNFTLDGTAPAAGSGAGHALAAGDSYVLRGSTAILNFKCIDRVSSSAGSVKVTMFH